MVFNLPSLSFAIQNIPREDFAINDGYFPLDLERWRVFDAFQTALPGTAASDDLGLYGGTHGTDVPYIGTGDFKATAITRKARITFRVPAQFVANQGAMKIVAYAGMKTTVAGTSCTLAFSAYKASGSVITGANLVTTPATDINSLSWANKEFAIDPTVLGTTDTILPGDDLDILATIAGVDAATATAVIAGFRAALVCSVRG